MTVREGLRNLAPWVVLILILIGVPLSVILAPRLGVLYNNAREIQLVNIAISSILSTSLALLYLYSSTYQKKLANIQESQWDSETQPNITVDAIKSRERTLGGVVLRLSNVGRGVATDLEMEVEPVLKENSIEAEKRTHTLTRHNPSDTEWKAARGNHIRAGEYSIEFDGSVNLTNIMEDREYFFGYFTEMLSNNGEENYRFKIYIMFKDGQQNNSDKKEALDYIVPIKGSTSIKEALKHGMRYEEYESDHRKLERKRSRVEADTGNYP